MFYKLAVRNVRRSARDYAIYFVTVALGVAMFYAFNAINSQTVLFDAMSADSARMLGLLSMLLGLFSAVVACVLGFLVVYANRFLIRRRRREFGTYLMLGMSAGRVSRILLYETSLVGFASLIAGLALGVALSQGLSFAAAALLGTTMSKYRFIVSGEALLLTCLCFAGIFAISALVDIIYLRRCKLATLLARHEASESVKPIRMPLRVAGFLASLVLLTGAYWQLKVNGMLEMNVHFWIATILMLMGTFLFYWSAAGFCIAVLTQSPGLYFKGLRMFTVRQVASKINTSFASMGVICVMLFFALTVTSVGMGLVQLFVGDLENSTRYDMTILGNPLLLVPAEGQDEALMDPRGEYRAFYDRYQGDMAACFADRSATWGAVVKATAQLDYYTTGVTFSALLDQLPDMALDADLASRIKQTEMKVISVGQYNRTCALIGAPQIALAADECAVNNLLTSTDSLARALCQQGVSWTLGGTQLHMTGTPQAVPMRTSAMSDVGLELIVPDVALEGFATNGIQEDIHIACSYLNVMYSTDRLKGDELMTQALEEAFPVEERLTVDENYYSSEDAPVYTYNPWPLMNDYSGRAMTDQAAGLRMVITFLALYIGFVMLVATAAILAIQQLSETADSVGRYRRLFTLGADDKMLLGSLRAQTVTYFAAPLVLAVAHTVCAVLVVSSTLFSELGVDISGSILLAFGMVVLLYGVYLVLTYRVSRGLIRGAGFALA